MNKKSFNAFGFLGASLLLIHAAGAFAAGSDRSAQSCTAMGCEFAWDADGVTDGVSIQPQENYRWQAGTYRFQFTLDGRSVACEARLPLPACSAHTQCEGRDVQIEELGCALPAPSQGFGRIHVKSYPSSLTLEIFRDGRSIGKLATGPLYKTTRPNGPECEPVCRQAHQTIELR